MGTPEFPNLGKHCSVEDCKQIDFLPFTCDRCTLIENLEGAFNYRVVDYLNIFLLAIKQYRDIGVGDWRYCLGIFLGTSYRITQGGCILLIQKTFLLQDKSNGYHSVKWGYIYLLAEKPRVVSLGESGEKACLLRGVSWEITVAAPCLLCFSDMLYIYSLKPMLYIVFCLDHRSYGKHRCPKANKQDVTVVVCPLCAKGVRLIPDEDPNITWETHVNTDCDPSNYERVAKKKKCPVPRCKELLTFSNTIKCRDCVVDHCLKHRFGPDHNCSGPKKLQIGLGFPFTSFLKRSQKEETKPSAPNWATSFVNAASSSMSKLSVATNQAFQMAKDGVGSSSSDSMEICPRCPMKFNSVKDLVEHVENVHERGGNNKPKVTIDACPKCSRGFHDPVKLVEHVEKDHGGTSKPFIITDYFALVDLNSLNLHHLQRSNQSPESRNNLSSEMRSFKDELRKKSSTNCNKTDSLVLPKVDSKVEIIHEKVKKQVIKQGRGEKLSKGSVCTLHYRLWIKSTEHKLEDTWHQHSPTKLVLGKEKKEMAGLGIGALNMRAGEHALLHVGWELGFGKEGNSHVSPMADLVYEVEVISVDDNKEGKTHYESDKTVEERIKGADAMKMEGNAFFKDEKLEEAMQQYEMAISLLEKDWVRMLIDRDWALAVKNPCHLNMAACLLKLKRYEKAIAHCGIVLAEDKNNVKALFRRGKANVELGHIDAAREDFLKARKHAPEDKAIAKELHSLAEHDKTVYQKQKELFKGIFGPSTGVNTPPDSEKYLVQKHSSYSSETGLTRRSQQRLDCRFEEDEDHVLIETKKDV
ncbi:hypothetical protein GIB67_040067 [Kingdonia uniflora]|uniref:peptidylprolyl isomerase n=1 Tax=Kingdonia uniflora TaxID=39325 RepID=A0A7J7MUI8_9MAGN|nr:hypothetical protein GIB67_040067 [Kingdonia uniflora]